jgi:hypothetical protein
MTETVGKLSVKPNCFSHSNSYIKTYMVSFPILCTKSIKKGETIQAGKIIQGRI